MCSDVSLVFMFGRLVGRRLVFFLISELVRLFVWLDEGQMKKEKEYLGVKNAAKSCVFEFLLSPYHSPLR